MSEPMIELSNFSKTTYDEFIELLGQQQQEHIMWSSEDIIKMAIELYADNMISSGILVELFKWQDITLLQKYSDLARDALIGHRLKMVIKKYKLIINYQKCDNQNAKQALLLKSINNIIYSERFKIDYCCSLSSVLTLLEDLLAYIA